MSKSIIEEKNAKQCFICSGTQNLERHHIFYGTSNRKNSDKYGLTVHLCQHHHRDSKEGVHFNKELDTELKNLHRKDLRKNMVMKNLWPYLEKTILM